MSKKGEKTDKSKNKRKQKTMRKKDTLKREKVKNLNPKEKSTLVFNMFVNTGTKYCTDLSQDHTLVAYKPFI